MKSSTLHRRDISRDQNIRSVNSILGRCLLLCIRMVIDKIFSSYSLTNMTVLGFSAHAHAATPNIFDKVSQLERRKVSPPYLVCLIAMVISSSRE